MKQSNLITLCQEITTLSQRIASLTEELAEAQSKLDKLLPQIEPLDSELPILFLASSEDTPQGVRGPDLKERQERIAEHPPVSFPNGTRPNRWRGSPTKLAAGVEEGAKAPPYVREFLYRTPQYNTVAVRLSVGRTSDWIVPRSGKRFKGVWLTEKEHTLVLAGTKGGE
jgi:hypothetical protein